MAEKAGGLKRLASFFGIIVFIYILYRLDLRKLVSIFASANLLLLASSAVLAPVILFVMALRWWWLLRALRVEYSVWRSYSSLVRGALLGEVTPGRLGEFLRAKYVTHDTGTSGGRTVLSVVLDRLYDIIFLVLTALVGGLGLSAEPVKEMPESALLLLAAGIVSAGIVLMNERLVRRILKPLSKVAVPGRLRVGARFQFEEFYLALRALKPVSHVICMGFTIGVWLLKFFALFLLALALGISAPFWFVASVGAVGIFVSFIPISISGFGTRDAVFIYCLGLRGITAESAVALSFLLLVHGIFGVLASVLLVWTREKVHYFCGDG